MKKKVNGKATTKFLLLLALIVTICYILIKGITIGVYDIGNIGDHFNYGLDLTGGVNVVLQAEATDNSDITDEKMDATVAALKNRVDALGVSEATVSRQGDTRIRVSIPSIQNQQEALDMIGKTAQLEFIDPNGDVILTGEDVVDSEAVNQTSSSGIEEPVVTLEFNDEGTKLFAEATKEFQGQVIKIQLDGEDISTPTVNAEITTGEAVIEGMADLDEAGDLAELIRGGALPVKLSPLEVTTVGPTLGQDSLSKSILGGAIGIAAVLIFMLLIYRGLGLIADIGLVIFIILNLLTMEAMNVTLTLPGIAGLILTIGMAVDANVIIFERIKEETRAGKTIKAAVESGFKRAMGTIIDSNVTTLIAGFVLFFLGNGSVQGFAVTLVMGIIISLFTAIVVTRHIIKLTLSTNLFNSQKFFGIKEV